MCNMQKRRAILRVLALAVQGVLSDAEAVFFAGDLQLHTLAFQLYISFYNADKCLHCILVQSMLNTNSFGTCHPTLMQASGHVTLTAMMACELSKLIES